MTKKSFHPVTEIFPLMSDDALSELAADIKANGLREPIWTYQGEIIDGRNRYRACERIGVNPSYREWDGDGSLVDFVMSLNLHRRHLTASQRSTVAARARDVYDKEAKERQREAGEKYHKGKSKVPVTLPEPSKGDSRDRAGKAVGVSGAYVDRATKVIKKGIPELVKAVDEGKMSVTRAAKISELPHDDQKQAIRRQRHVEFQPRQPPPKFVGVGIIKAHEAIKILSRIPRKDRFREEGFQIVKDWINDNK